MALILDSTPDVLSMGRRCMEDGYSFVWPAYSCSPQFQLPTGEVLVCQVRGFIPYVDASIACPAPVMPLGKAMKPALPVGKTPTVYDDPLLRTAVTSLSGKAWSEDTCVAGILFDSKSGCVTQLPPNSYRSGVVRLLSYLESLEHHSLHQSQYQLMHRGPRFYAYLLTGRAKA